MVDGIGRGWAFTLTALLFVLFSPLFWVLIRYGPRWRKARKDKEEQNSQKAGHAANGGDQKPTQNADDGVATEGIGNEQEKTKQTT